MTLYMLGVADVCGALVALVFSSDVFQMKNGLLELNCFLQQL